MTLGRDVAVELDLEVVDGERVRDHEGRERSDRHHEP
jgi:hypothetical protein